MLDLPINRFTHQCMVALNIAGRAKDMKLGHVALACVCLGFCEPRSG